MAILKPATIIDQQIEILRERGMTLDESLARQWLANVSYYRLSGYWYSYRVLPADADPKTPRRLDIFETKTSFSDIARLYEFDRKLRTLIHDGMERIEVGLRARISDRLALTDALSYLDPALFRPEFDHSTWLDTALARVERAKKRDSAIKHYASNYGEYPIWVLVEALDFSDISQLFDGMVLADQRAISESLGLVVDSDRLTAKQKGSYYRQDPLARWCEQFTVLRNICAHHGRLWNRSLTPASTNALRTITDLSSLPRGQSDRIFGAILLMSFLLRQISPGTSWPNKVRHLIESEYLPLESRSITEMGIPQEWQKLSLWNNPTK